MNTLISIDNFTRLAFLCLVLLITTVSGCTSIHSANDTANGFKPANKIIDRPVTPPAIEVPTKAAFLFDQSPEIKKAFTLYEKTGKTPIIKTGQFVEFPFDSGKQPIINCQPLRACDIELESGEHITGVYTGDSSRWLYQEAVSGEGEQQRWHVIFKPKDWNISTDVIITTSKRTYHLGLISKRHQYVRQVKFYYPERLQHQWDTVNRQAMSHWANKNQRTIATLPNVNLDKIDDNYSIKTNKGLFGHQVPWMPIRVFNTGTQQVFIEMPRSMANSDAPALFVMNSDGEKALVNYRVRHHWYIVDDRFKQAVLVAGSGRHQQRVTITYNG